MIASLVGSFRLLRMARLLLAQDALLPEGFVRDAPWSLKAARWLFTLGVTRLQHADRSRILSDHIARLGPTYIKLGQFLATRPDMIGIPMARDLRHLQDKMAPFEQAIAEKMVAETLSHPERVIAALGPPIAAASIAQVHRATDARDPTKFIAVKLLRPGIEKTIANEIRALSHMAWLVEKFVPATRRLRPVDSVNTLARSMALETDLRLEAAALAQLYENTEDDPHFTVPRVIWETTNKRILTMEWMHGVAASQVDDLKTAGHDMPQLAVHLIQSFLQQALRDGFFHADLHQGNLLIRADGVLIGIDLGINGRLDGESRQFLAEILLGFIERDYDRVAQVHFDAGYVPPDHSLGEFSQALRSIGEPIRDQTAENISMAHLLAQLFEVTAQFSMETQPQLLLLQKTMVTVEGVARSFDPQLNIWDAAEPIVSAWLRRQVGPEAQLRRLRDGFHLAQKSLHQLPQTLTALETAAQYWQHPHPPKDRLARALALVSLAALVGWAAYTVFHL